MTTYIAEFIDPETEEVLESYLVHAPNLPTAMEMAEGEAADQGLCVTVEVRTAHLIQF